MCRARGMSTVGMERKIVGGKFTDLILLYGVIQIGGSPVEPTAENMSGEISAISYSTCVCKSIIERYAQRYPTPVLTLLRYGHHPFRGGSGGGG